MMIDEILQSQLRSKYNPDGSTLRKAQLQMLEILKTVDGICRKHNIPYWLSSGTLLGAVRHGGFIPWDDDVDIEMLRDDYLKLLPILEKELPDNFCLQNYKTEKECPFLFSKVRDKNSLIKETSKYSLKHEGLFIDIFVLEKSFYPIFRISAMLYNRLCYKLYGYKTIFYLNRWILNSVVFPFFRLVCRLDRTQTLRHTFGMGFFKERKKNEIFPLKEIKFENSCFYAPCDCDGYLSRIFGNYMELPENIQSHGDISIEE